MGKKGKSSIMKGKERNKRNFSAIKQGTALEKRNLCYLIKFLDYLRRM